VPVMSLVFPHKLVTNMHILEVIKPLTPSQARIDGLKKQKENVSKQLKAERDRQKIAKAQQTISNINSAQANHL